MTYHDNEVRFTDDHGYITGGSYTIEDFSITKGQDPDGKITKGMTVQMKNGALTFRVGRKGSSDTADWFNKNIPAGSNTFGHEADELNFAFIGTLKLKLDFKDGEGEKEYTFSSTALAQGHSGSTNNWWFGGRVCQHVDNDSADIHDCVLMNGISNSKVVRVLAKRGGNDADQVGIFVLDVQG